jgi:DNA invertase Pin-like site-specific DNA recombinase
LAGLHDAAELDQFYLPEAFGDGAQLLATCGKLGMEGIVSKRVDRPYMVALGSVFASAYRWNIRQRSRLVSFQAEHLTLSQWREGPDITGRSFSCPRADDCLYANDDVEDIHAPDCRSDAAERTTRTHDALTISARLRPPRSLSLKLLHTMRLRPKPCQKARLLFFRLDRSALYPGARLGAGCDLIFKEKASGKSLKKRPELEKAIDRLGTGDVLVAAEWDRATRSMFDGITIMQRVHARGAFVKVLDKPHLDLTTALGRGFLGFLSALAEDERERITKRAADGRKAAIARGVQMGRKPKLTEHQVKVARKRMAAGESARAIAKEMGVAHTTVARVAA